MLLRWFIVWSWRSMFAILYYYLKIIQSGLFYTYKGCEPLGLDVSPPNTTITLCTGDTFDIKPGEKISWVNPLSGEKSEYYVKTIEDGQTITVESIPATKKQSPPTFNYRDEVAPWPPNPGDIKHYSKSHLPPITVYTIPVSEEFQDFISKLCQGVEKQLSGLKSHPLNGEASTCPEKSDYNKPNLKIIDGGVK